MNQRSDIERVLNLWLDDGPSAMPDRVVDVVAERISRQPQRRSWRFLRRLPMNPLFKLSAAVAAVLVVAVTLGSLFFGWPLARSGIFGPGPSPSPVASPSPSLSASQSPLPMYAGALPAGTYVTRPFEGSSLPTRITFTVPSGWSGFPNWGLLGPEGSGASGGIGIGFLTAAGLFSDPCHWDAKGDGTWPQQGDIAIGPAVDDLVTALGVQPGYTASPPIDVVLSGYSGKRVDLQLPADVDTAKCDNLAGHTEGAYFVWGTSDRGGNDLYLQGPGQRWRLWILDVQNTRVVIVVDDYANTSTQDRAAAQQILDSVQITP